MKNESQKLDDLPILVICQSGIYFTDAFQQS